MTEQPAAFYFDRAIYTFGSALEAELDRVSQQGKGRAKKTDSQIAMARANVMARWLGTTQRFADPTKRG